MTTSAINILKQVHLFELEMPFYPEDLAFYKKGGACWFGSVAHEQIAFFTDPELPVEEVKRRFPHNKIDTYEEQ